MRAFLGLGKVAVTAPAARFHTKALCQAAVGDDQRLAGRAEGQRGRLVVMRVRRRPYARPPQRGGVVQIGRDDAECRDCLAIGAEFERPKPVAELADRQRRPQPNRPRGPIRVPPGSAADRSRQPPQRPRSGRSAAQACARPGAGDQSRADLRRRSFAPCFRKYVSVRSGSNSSNHLMRQRRRARACGSGAHRFASPTTGLDSQTRGMSKTFARRTAG